MITHLFIKNLAIINESAISFDKNLVVITGETGSGKSILIDALGLIGGARAGNELIGPFGEKCIVEATFELNELINNYLKKNQLDIYNDLIIRREFSKNGKSRVFINDTPVQLAELKNLMLKLFHIHSQFSNVEIKSKKQQIKVLDSFSWLGNKLEDFRLLLEKFREIEAKIADTDSKLKQLSNSKDYTSFLINEIESLELNNTNYDELEKKLNKEEFTEKIILIINEIVSLEKENSTLDSFINLKNSISRISKKVQGFEEMEESIFNLIEALQKLISLAYSYDVESTMSNTEKQEILMKIDELNRVFNKHRISNIDELKTIYNNLLSSNVNVNELESQLIQLKKNRKEIHANLTEIATELHNERLKNKKDLEHLMAEKFDQLNMQDAELKIELTERNDFNEFGKTDIEFMVSLNKGNDFFPLDKIASGGELSRITLAIQSIISSKSNLPTILFDEIDSGIGGETARKIGGFLLDLASKRQVVVITHFAQVAAKANQHLNVRKTTSDGQTFSLIKNLEGIEREEELAKMISGSSANSFAVETAKTLLNEESARN